MSSVSNGGLIIFGADPDAAPPPGPPTSPPQPGGMPPPPGAPPGQPGDPSLAVGAKFPPLGARCLVTCKYKGGTKIEKAKAPGKAGAKQTVTGAKVAEVDVEIQWADIEPTASAMFDAIQTISPHGANKGKSWDWTERFAGLYAVGAVIVEEMSGPDPAKGSDEMTLKLKLSGFDKNQQVNAGTGQGTTPTSSQKYTPPGAPAADPAFPSKPLVTP